MYHFLPKPMFSHLPKKLKCVWAVFVTLLSGSISFGQTAETILNSYFKLNGGKNEICEHYRNSRVTQQIVMHANGDTVTIISVTADKVGGSEEMVVNLGGTKLRQISTFTQKKGWDIKVTQNEESNPDTTSVEAWTDEKLKEQLNCKKGVTHPCYSDNLQLVVVGIEAFEGHKSFKIEDKSKSTKDHKEFHFFDFVTNQYYGSKATDTAENGTISTALTLVKDYRKYGNITIPYLTEITKDGEKMSFILMKMESKLKFSESDFSVNAKK